MVMVSGTCGHVNGLTHGSWLGIEPGVMSSQKSLVRALLLQWLQPWLACTRVCLCRKDSGFWNDWYLSEAEHPQGVKLLKLFVIPFLAMLLSVLLSTMWSCASSTAQIVSSCSFPQWVLSSGFLCPFTSISLFSNLLPSLPMSSKLNSASRAFDHEKSLFLYHRNFGSFPPSSLPFAKRII